MRRLRPVMTAMQTPPAFEPKGVSGFHRHDRGNSAPLQAVFATAAKGTHYSLPFEDLGSFGRGTQSGGGKVQFEETIVHILRDDPVRTKQLTEFFCFEGTERRYFQNRCRIYVGRAGR
ncbi:MAG: hypothetical protein ABSF78_00105 [Candidatus Acidiferrales bacterium]|jgi:hypothetical protein